MRKILLVCFALLFGTIVRGQETKVAADTDAAEIDLVVETADTKPPKVKKGWNFGPLPAIGYNSDLGFQYGVLCDVFYYGDGSVFPDYVHKFNVELSQYTKGSGVYHLFYDSKYLIPKVRLTFAATYMPNRMMSFYGFNGFASPYSADLAKENPAFYAIDRKMLRVMADFQGRITDNIGWAAGISFWDYRTGHVRLQKYADKTTLWDHYAQGDNPIIPLSEQGGGAQLELKAGLVFDTRDHEPAPSKGMWAEVIAYGSPDVIERNGNAYLKVAAHFRHYITLVHNRLTLAYHLAYQGTVAGRAPFYVQQNISTLYLRQINSEGLGGINTVRGILFNRMVGDGYFWGNVELRCRLFDFRLFGQDWYLAVNPFLDAGMVVQPYRLDEMKASADPEIYSSQRETMHLSAGAGLKAVMNRNFIVSVEMGFPFDKRDGANGMNIGLNYIF